MEHAPAEDDRALVPVDSPAHLLGGKAAVLASGWPWTVHGSQPGDTSGLSVRGR